MPFVKGKSGNPTGRPHGAISPYTATVKETVLRVFQELQLDPEHDLKAFARKYPRDFIVIAAKLIPLDVKAEITVPEGIKITYAADTKCSPIGTDPESNAGILGEQTGL
jgi:hypothetical protein